MVGEGAVRVLGASPFHDTALTASGRLSYLGGNWERDIAFAGYSIPLQAPRPAGRLPACLHVWRAMQTALGRAGTPTLLPGMGQSDNYFALTSALRRADACIFQLESSCLCARARRKAAARARRGQGDFPARRMIESVTGVRAARRARLMRVLDIDPEWRMHRVSDGQRRRVQICLGLLHPFQAGPPPPSAERGASRARDGGDLARRATVLGRPKSSMRQLSFGCRRA